MEIKRSYVFAIVILTIITSFFTAQHSYSQEFGPIITLKQVEKEFKESLSSISSDSDTIRVYMNHIERLIKRGNYTQADSILVKTEKNFIALNDSTLLAELYKHRAFMNKVQRRFPKSLADYLWLKKYYESKNNLNELVEIYSLMAEYYRAIRKFELMQKHLDLAEEIHSQVQVDQDHIAYWYSRVASIHTEYYGNADSAIYFGEKGLILAKESNDIYTESLILNELGFHAIYNIDERELAKKYLGRAMEILLKHERYRDYVDVANNYIRPFFQEDENSAIQLTESIIELEEQNNWYGPLITSLDMARGHYNHLGQMGKVDEAIHKIYEARIKEIQTDNEIAVNDLALTYQNQLTEKELEVQEQRAQLAEKEAINNKRAFAISAIVAFFLSVISLIIYQVNRRFKKKNLLLDKRAREIEIANTELERSLDNQKVIYKELNHRVKNNLSVLTGLVYMQEQDIIDEQVKSYFSNLRNRINSMALAHESLYNNDENKRIVFSEYLKNLFDTLKLSLSQVSHVITKINLPHFEMNLQELVPLGLIMNELFTNSIKHGFRNKEVGKIEVSGSITHQEILIHYRDDGSGYDPKKQAKTGLRLIHLLMEQMNAKLKDKSSSEGFYVILHFPTSVRSK